MEVPFERLGPGQVGRLAYQVIGSDGPIKNPARIRYMSPDEVIAPDAVTVPDGLLEAFDAAGGMIQLGLVSANLAVGVATLREVRQVKTAVKAIEGSVLETSARLQQIFERVERIDVGVAAQNLRSAMRHLLKQSIRDDLSVDLRVLSGVESDLSAFYEAIGSSGLGLHPSLRLPSDLRSMIELVKGLYRGARLATWADWNVAVAGDPDQVLTEAPQLVELVDTLNRVQAVVDMQVLWRGMAQLSGEHLAESFFSQAAFRALSEFHEGPGLDAATAFVSGHYSAELELLAVVGEPYEVLAVDEGGRDEARNLLFCYLDHWHDRTDSGLLYQLSVELDYYNSPDSWPSEVAFTSLGGVDRHGSIVTCSSGLEELYSYADRLRRQSPLDTV